MNFEKSAISLIVFPFAFLQSSQAQYCMVFSSNYTNRKADYNTISLCHQTGFSLRCATSVSQYLVRKSSGHN